MVHLIIGMSIPILDATDTWTSSTDLNITTLGSTSRHRVQRFQSSVLLVVILDSKPSPGSK
jgi:hypothetical protein